MNNLNTNINNSINNNNSANEIANSSISLSLNKSLFSSKLGLIDDLKRGLSEHMMIIMKIIELMNI